MDTQDALTLIFQRNYFYRRQYLLAFSALILAILVIIILSTILWFMLRNPTRPIYFATDNVGRLVHIVPVNQPNMSTDDVIAWSMQAVQETLSYDFMNYRAQLQSAQKYFTPYGWQTYKEAFNAANNLPSVLENKMIVLARVISTPKVVTEGLLGDAYAWKLQMPVLVIYWKPPYDDNSKFSNAITENILVQRQPVLQSYKGLGIVQLYFTSATSTPNQPQEISGASTAG